MEVTSPKVEVVKAKERKPGEAPLNRIPVFDHKGNMRGHVGSKATEVTASRFLGRPGAKLGIKDGRDAWIGDKPPPKPMPKITKPAAPVAPPAGAQQKHSLEISLKADKGSVKKPAGATHGKDSSK